MPHVVDVEEKQPFLEEDDDDVTNDSKKQYHHHHLHLNNKSHPNHLVNISSYSNGEINGSSSGSINGKSCSISLSEQSAARTARSLYVMKLLSALFYAVASFLITVVNKVVLTSYK